MITRSKTDASEGHVITLRPNGSLGWRAAKWACAGVALLSAVIVTWFTLRGAWLVLPFAGAEMLLLASAFYLACRRSSRVEVLRVEPDVLVLQSGRRRPEVEHRLLRAWARAVLVRDPSGWYPSRLLLRSHGRSIEVGAWLVEEERLELAAELARLTGSATAFDPAPPLPDAPAAPAPTRSLTT